MKRINDIRNVVAHNEPIFPLLVNDNMKSALTTIFNHLKENYKCSKCKTSTAINIPHFSLINKNGYNDQYINKIECFIQSLV